MPRPGFRSGGRGEHVETLIPPGIYALVVDARADAVDPLLPTDEARVATDLVVLPVRSAWMVVRRPGHPPRGLAPLLQTSGEADPRRWVALVREEDDDEDALADEAIVHVPGGSVVRTNEGWAGDGWSLEPHPWTQPHLRCWTWIDPITWEGSALRVRHTRSRDEVRAWLAAHAPLPYEETSPDVFEDAQTSGQRARITLRDGLLELRHFYSTRDAVNAVEAGLAADVGSGALGPIVWDVTDEDWGVYLASGDDGASLAGYVDRRTGEEAHRAHRRALVTQRAFEVGFASTQLSLVQAIARELGLGEVSDVDEFVNRLARRRTGELPRSWLVRVHPALSEERVWFAQVCARAQPRLRLAWQIA